MPDPTRTVLYSIGNDPDGIAVDVLPVHEDHPTAALVVYEDNGMDVPGYYLDNPDTEHLSFELPNDLWQLAPLAQAIIDAAGFTGTVVCDASRDALFAETRDVILAELRDHPPGPAPATTAAGGIAASVLRFLAQRNTGALTLDSDPDVLAQYQRAQRPPTLLDQLIADGRIPTEPLGPTELAAAAKCYAAAGAVFARVPAEQAGIAALIGRYEAAGDHERAERARQHAAEDVADPLGTYYGRNPDGSVKSPSALDHWPWPDFSWRPGENAEANFTTASALLTAAAEVSAKA